MRLRRMRPVQAAERVSRSLPPELTFNPYLPTDFHRRLLEAQLQRTETELQGLIEQEVETGP
jgi:hypothetical protein